MWVNITSNPKRDIRTVILEPGMKEGLLDDAREFLNSRSWYAARGSCSPLGEVQQSSTYMRAMQGFHSVEATCW